MLDEATLKDCLERFAEESAIVGVWILGSAVKERLLENSDVDFAILWEEGIDLDFRKVGALASDLEKRLGRRVDLGRLNTRNLIYAHEAIRTGKLIYCRTAGEADRFTEKVLALYFDLKRDRKVVEDAYCA